MVSKIVESIYDQHEAKNYLESNQLIQELLSEHTVDPRTYLMTNTLQASNFKELGEFSKARGSLTNLIGKLRSEYGQETLPESVAIEQFISGKNLGVDQIKEHFKAEDAGKTENFLQYFQKLASDINEGLQTSENDPEFLKLQQAWQEDPSNLENCFMLAEKAAELQKYELSVELLLSIIESDKKWQEGQAVDRIKQLFIEIGNGNPIVHKARKELSFLLY